MSFDIEKFEKKSVQDFGEAFSFTETFLTLIKSGKQPTDAYKSAFALPYLSYAQAKEKLDKFLVDNNLHNQMMQAREFFLSAKHKPEMEKSELINSLIYDIRDPGLRPIDKIKYAQLLSEINGWIAPKKIEQKNLNISISSILDDISS